MTGALPVLLAGLCLVVVAVLWGLRRKRSGAASEAQGQVVVLGARGARKPTLIASQNAEWLEISVDDPPPQGAIAGVVLVLSLADLLSLPAGTRAAQARALAASLSQLPAGAEVQIVLNKADLLPGFAVSEILSRVRTLTAADSPAEIWDALCARVMGDLPAALLQLEDPARRGALTELPGYLAALRAPVVETLTLLCEGGQSPPVSLSFTALHQAAAPPDRLLPGMLHSFGLGRPAAPPRPERLPEPVIPAFSAPVPRRSKRPGLSGAAAGIILLALGGYASVQIRAEHRALDELSAQITTGAVLAEASFPVTRLPGDLPLRLQAEQFQAARTAQRMRELEAQISASMSDPLRLRGALAGYLTLGQASPPDSAALVRWFAPGNPDLSEILRAPLPPVRLNAALIRQARGVLTRQPQAQRIYARLRETAAVRALPDLRLADLAGPRADEVLTLATRRPEDILIEGLYTPEGAAQVVLPALENPGALLADRAWIEGEEIAETPGTAALQAVSQEVAGLYARDYTAQYQRVLSDVNIRPAGVAAHQSQILALVESDSSPLRQLLHTLAQNTRFEGDPAALRQVARHFRGLQQVITATRGADLLMPASGQDVSPARLILAGSPLPRGVMEEPLRRWSAQLSPGPAAEARAALAQFWQAEVLPLCEAVTLGRYPFAPHAQTDATLAEFTEFFGPGGLMARFRDRYLALSDEARIPGGGPAPALSAEFARTEAITAMYFPAGSEPGLTFSLQAEALGGSTGAVDLHLGAQRYRFDPGTAGAQQVVWTAGSGVSALGAGRDRLQGEGVWSWLRLLDRAESSPAARPDLFRAVFTLAGHRVMFQISSGPAADPFARAALSEFRCPRGI